MVKVAIVGAGSLVFTRKLVSDLVRQDVTADAQIHLMDIDTRRLREVGQFAQAIVQSSGSRAEVILTDDLAQAVRGASYVVNTIAVGGKHATTLDFDIPERYGVRQTIADTHGIGGISRAARTIPRVLEIARVVEREAPDAWFLNETNPMAMVVTALGRATSVRHVGLCHDVENTARELARYLGLAHVTELSWHAAGINHMTWFLGLNARGNDMYPQLREQARNMAVRAQDPVRFELMSRFGYFVSESSIHNAEYYPWFLSRADVSDAFGIQGREYLTILDNLSDGFSGSLASLRAQGNGAVQMEAPTVEYAPRIVASLESHVPFSFMGNVTNSGGLISNLPNDCCVEVPCTVRGSTIVPGHVGRLPEPCAALNRMAINVQLLTVEGILRGERDLLYQAAYVDPLLSAQLKLDDIRRLVDDILDAHELGHSFV